MKGFKNLRKVNVLEDGHKWPDSAGHYIDP
jgi:hypothetical protein